MYKDRTKLFNNYMLLKINTVRSGRNILKSITINEWINRNVEARIHREIIPMIKVIKHS